MLDFSILFELALQAWMDFRYNGMRENLWVSACWCVIGNLYDGNLLMKIGSGWSGPKSSFSPLSFYWQAQENVEHKPFKSLKFVVFSHKDYRKQHYR